MQGHLRERSKGVWELMVPLGRDPVTGRYRRVSRSFHGTKRDAQRQLAALVTDVGAGRETGSNMTVGELMDQWLVFASEHLSPTTLRGYHSIVEAKVKPALGKVLIRKLRADQLDALYRGLSQEHSLAPGTVRQVHAVLRRALGQAVKWGWIPTNPAANATPPRMRKAQITPPSIEEMLALIKAADRVYSDLGVFLRLTAATGIRRGEACALRWTDLDLDASVLVVSRSLISVSREALVEKDTKTHAARKLALDTATVSMLRTYLRECHRIAAACGVELLADGFVFSEISDGSRPWYPDTATSRFEIVRATLGLEHVRLHDLRHLHATQLLAAGVPVRTVSGRLGHANAATTLNVYAHFLEASDQHAASVIGALLDPSVTKRKATRAKVVKARGQRREASASSRVRWRGVVRDWS